MHHTNTSDLEISLLEAIFRKYGYDFSISQAHIRRRITNRMNICIKDNKSMVLK
jgi:hypothetical protein